MKIKIDYIRNPIIVRLLIAQFFVVGLGFLAVFLACIAINRFNNDRQMERLKKELSISIMTHEDQLLAWSQLGMVSAQNELIDQLKSQLHLRNLKIVKEDEFNLVDPSSFTFVLDSKLAKDLDKLVLVEVEPEHLHFRSISPSAGLLIALSFLALLTVFYSAYFILQNVFKPIHNLRLNLERLESAEEISFDSTRTIGEIKDIINAIQRLYLKSMTKENERIRSKLAQSLAHDIRSPLAALKVVKEMSASSLDADVAKLLTMSIDRITDIANTILPKSSSENSPISGTESSFIWMLGDQIVSEKRVEYKNANNVSIQLEVDGSPFELNALCNPSEFMRSVSNIINNSIEARVSNQPIQIDLKLHSNNDMILLSITDNGKGISPEILSKVFDESFSHGKSQGTGLGLFQVKQAVESWGGRVHIESQVGTGTKITLELKKSQKPQWLADSISIQQYDSMVVLDDEEYVFTILQDRFSEHFKNIRYFKRIEEFETFLPETTNALLFIDHDLKQTATGIDLIQKHQLQNRSILLTGNYDDKQVQQRSTQNNIKILPKPLINDIPVVS